MRNLQCTKQKGSFQSIQNENVARVYFFIIMKMNKFKISYDGQN